MKTMTRTLNKLFITMLSFVTMFVCAFTFPMHKASASTTVNDEPIPDEVLVAFMENVMEDIQLVEGGDPFCFLFDYRFFENAVSHFDIDASTMLSDINDSPIIQAMAWKFAELLGIDSYIVTINGIISNVEPIFNQINMNIIIHYSLRMCVNVMTGESTHSDQYFQLSSWNDYVTPSTSIYAMLVLPRDGSNYYSLLLSTQEQHSGPLHIYAYTERNINSGLLNATVYTRSDLL